MTEDIVRFSTKMSSFRLRAVDVFGNANAHAWEGSKIMLTRQYSDVPTYNYCVQVKSNPLYTLS